MIKDTKPHTFGSAREMTPEEKESVDAAFKGLRVENTRIEELKQQLREKEARIARLEESAQMAILRNPYCDRLEDVLNETPQQSLAAIRADAVDRFADLHLEGQALFAAVEYANQLRNEAKDG